MLQAQIVAQLRAKPARRRRVGHRFAAAIPGIAGRSQMPIDAEGIKQRFERRILGAEYVARKKVVHVATGQLIHQTLDRVLGHALAGGAVALP